MKASHLTCAVKVETVCGGKDEPGCQSKATLPRTLVLPATTWANPPDVQDLSKFTFYESFLFFMNYCISECIFLEQLSMISLIFRGFKVIFHLGR